MRRNLNIAILSVLLFAAYQFAASETQASGAKKSAVATFSKDVAPILFKNCAQCHQPGSPVRSTIDFRGRI